MIRAEDVLKGRDRIVPSKLDELSAAGWRSAAGVEACRACGHGTTSLDPNGEPKHVRCFYERASVLP